MLFRLFPIQNHVGAIHAVRVRRTSASEKFYAALRYHSSFQSKLLVDGRSLCGQIQPRRGQPFRSRQMPPPTTPALMRYLIGWLSASRRALTTARAEERIYWPSRKKSISLTTCSTRTSATDSFLLAIDAEIIVEHSHRAVSIDSKVQGLVHQEIVLRTLADNPEVVYERFIRLAILERILKTFLRNAGPLVLCTGGLAGTTNALWLEMEEATDIVAIDGERNQGVQGAVKVHYLSGTAFSAGDEYSQIDIRSIIDLNHRVSRTDHDSQRGDDAHHHS